MEDSMPKWLRERINNARRKVNTLKDQLDENDNSDWQRERRLKWLRQAEIEHAWSEHWLTKV
jgi:hypothetical protein